MQGFFSYLSKLLGTGFINTSYTRTEYESSILLTFNGLQNDLQFLSWSITVQLDYP